MWSMSQSERNARREKNMPFEPIHLLIGETLTCTELPQPHLFCELFGVSQSFSQIVYSRAKRKPFNDVSQYKITYGFDYKRRVSIAYRTCGRYCFHDIEVF